MAPCSHSCWASSVAGKWGTKRGTGQVTTPYRFTGQREEATIGLYFYNARWYDAALARFIQPDTIVPEPGNPQALNRYAYVYNNPVKYTDPSGHAVFEERPDDPWIFSTAQVRSKNYWTHPEACKLRSVSDSEFLLALTSPFWGAVAAVGGFAAGEAIAAGAPVLKEAVAKAVRPAAQAVAQKVLTKQFLADAAISGAGGVAGDFLGHRQDYSLERGAKVFAVNAIGGGFLGAVYPATAGGQIMASGLTNIAVGSAQRALVGESTNVRSASEDFFWGVTAVPVGSALSLILEKTMPTSLGGSAQALASFSSHPNILSTLFGR